MTPYIIGLSLWVAVLLVLFTLHLHGRVSDLERESERLRENLLKVSDVVREMLTLDLKEKR